MIDMTSIIIFILTSLVLVLVLERFLYSQEMNKQIGDCMKALMARTPQDYVAMKVVDTLKPQVAAQPDAVPVESLSDDEFDKFVKNNT